MSRMRLNDILTVVREHGETGSYRDPKWAREITGLGKQIDMAIAHTVEDMTLADLLNQEEA